MSTIHYAAAVAAGAVGGAVAAVAALATLATLDVARSLPPMPSITIPVPAVPDGSTTDPGAHGAATDLPECVVVGDAEVPCRFPTETYIVGGDGRVHHGCLMVLTADDRSEQVCDDDTVWS